MRRVFDVFTRRQVGNWVAKSIVEPLSLRVRVQRLEKMIAVGKVPLVLCT